MVFAPERTRPPTSAFRSPNFANCAAHRVGVEAPAAALAAPLGVARPALVERPAAPPAALGFAARPLRLEDFPPLATPSLPRRIRRRPIWSLLYATGEGIPPSRPGQAARRRHRGRTRCCRTRRNRIVSDLNRYCRVPAGVRPTMQRGWPTSDSAPGMALLNQNQNFRCGR